MDLDNAFRELEASLSVKEEVHFIVTDTQLFNRCIYLIESLKISLPNWLLTKLPFCADLPKPRALWSKMLNAAWMNGKEFGEGSVEEFKQVLDRLIFPDLKSYEERIAFWSFLETLTSGVLIEENRVYSLEEMPDGREIPKFFSGFRLVDSVTQGLYQGLITIAGLPGSGKTSVVLGLLGELVKKFPCWYFQSEIPADMILSRINLVKPEKYVPGSKVFCGNYSVESIQELNKKEANLDRVILYDSPEIRTGLLEPLKYFDKAYQDLIQLKQACRAVIVTSQIKQGLSYGTCDQYCLSDSAMKARASDIIIIVHREGNTLLAKTVKNRFGDLYSVSLPFDFKNINVGEDPLESLYRS